MEIATKIGKITNWEKIPSDVSTFSADEVLNAYFEGKKDGVTSTQKAAFDAIDRNILKSAEIKEALVQNLTGMGISVFDSYLRINSIYNLHVLVTVSEDDFDKANFLEAYSITSKIEKQADFSLMFFYLSTTDKEVNEKMLFADGYHLKSRS